MTKDLRPIQPEPQDAHLIAHIRTWLELNRIRLNQRDEKRNDNQERREK